MKVSNFTSFTSARSVHDLPFKHCLGGNSIGLVTIEWCRTHSIGPWAYWFDMSNCSDDYDQVNQIAYIGFSSADELFLFNLSAPGTWSEKLDAEQFWQY